MTKNKKSYSEIDNSKECKTLEIVGYDNSKHNALKHGLLSKYTVMAWENAEDYQKLLDLLIAEHTPKGITEEHLVEELAGVIWRKMRLRYAENTSLQTSLSKTIGLNSFSMDSHDSAEDALLAKSDEVKGLNIREAIQSSEEENQEELTAIKTSLNYCLEAEKILIKSNSYKDGLAALSEEDRNNWQDEWLEQDNEDEEMKYTATTKGLLNYISESKKYYEKRTFELENREKVKKQILGQSFLSDSQLSTYSRYENHLDKKFGKTLGMLLKLKALRGDIELVTPL